MSFLDRIRTCQVYDAARYLPFRVTGQTVGLVERTWADLLRPFEEVFAIDDGGVSVAAHLTTAAARTAAVDGVLRALAAAGHLSGWRGESYPVAPDYGAPALLTLERAAVPRFGVRAYGVHLNGFVNAPDGLKMWIGRRSLTKHTAPGKLDQLVAGGQPAGLGIRANLLKEAEEEASLPAALVDRARPVGAITYRTEREEGLRNDVLFLFDLELPPDFVPVNRDGEIAEFYLLPIAEVLACVRDTDGFKFNCALVIIHFLLRHGFIEPDHRDYLDLVRGLAGP